MHWLLALFVFAMMFSCGCGKPESNGTAQGNAIAEECKSFLNASASAKGRAELDRKIKVAVQTASDWHVRSEIVRSMVAELLEADLSLHGRDYQDMSRRVSAYENCFECVVHWLFDSGLEGQYVMGGSSLVWASCGMHVSPCRKPDDCRVRVRWNLRKGAMQCGI